MDYAKVIEGNAQLVLTGVCEVFGIDHLLDVLWLFLCLVKLSQGVLALGQHRGDGQLQTIVRQPLSDVLALYT